MITDSDEFAFFAFLRAWQWQYSNQHYVFTLKCISSNERILVFFGRPIYFDKFDIRLIFDSVHIKTVSTLCMAPAQGWEQCYEEPTMELIVHNPRVFGYQMAPAQQGWGRSYEEPTRTLLLFVQNLRVFVHQIHNCEHLSIFRLR